MTTAAPSTTEPVTTLAPSTTEPPVTAPEPSGEVAVAVGPFGLLGWWDGTAGAWNDSDALGPDEIPVEPGDVFTVFTLGGPTSQSIAGEVELTCEFTNAYGPVLEPPIGFEFGEDSGSALGVRASWNVQPRPTSVLDPFMPELEEAVREQLAPAGLPDVPIRVMQAAEADLDGNGSTELVIAARHPDIDPSVGPRAGWFSIVLIIRGDGAGTVTSVFASDVHLEDDDSFPSMALFSVEGFGDFNGDGTMEVGVGFEVWEGAGTQVFEIVDGVDPELVLAGGCGS